MVWSDSMGVSIVLPSDRVAGDGRNYIVVGEDIPPSIADNFTAAIVFRNGGYGGSVDLPVGGGLSAGDAGVGFLYPAGFFYWAMGITTDGKFEIVCYYVVVPSPTAEAYITRRRSMFSANVERFAGGPPNDARPVMRFGSGTYNEGTVSLRTPTPISINDSDTDNFAAHSNATTGAYIGSPPAAGMQPIIKSGTIVGTTNAAGNLSIIYPTPFPNGVLSVIASAGDTASNLNACQCLGSSLTTTTIRCTTPAGSLVASGLVRINWIATGW